MRNTLIVFLLLLTAVAARAESSVGEVNGITIAAKSSCTSIPENALLSILAEQIAGMPYAIVPPGKSGMRIRVNLACNPFGQDPKMMLYSGVVAFENLARLSKPFSDVYWVPVYDYTFYGAAVDGDLNKPTVSGIQTFINSMSPVTRKAYLGMGMQSPVN